jgi:inhibitor of KinA
MTYSIKYRYISPYVLEISWPAKIDEEILWDIIYVKDALHARWQADLLNMSMGYHCLSIHFRSAINFSSLLTEIEEIRLESPSQGFTKKHRWAIPVCYDQAFGTDLNDFAMALKMDTEEVIQLHSSGSYLLFFYGFLPGFMYLGGLSEKLFLSRKEIPHRKVEKGSVAIGGKQTGIYPLDSPGGWWVIGRTPVRLFDFRSKHMTMAQPGDEIRFESVDQNQFKYIQKEEAAGRYTLFNEIIYE